MIKAVLGAKSKGNEYSEDILTSTVFGNLKYINNSLALIPFIELAFLYDENRTTLWQVFKAEGIELRCYQKVDYYFWSNNNEHGEPDLILIFSNHIHGLEDLLITIEIKFKSDKGGVGEKDQLARYFNAVDDINIEGFSDLGISGFKGRKGFIIYLTEVNTYSEISESEQIINTKHGKDRQVFQLIWYQLYDILDKMNAFYTTTEKAIADDLMDYLEKIGLRGFSGITRPDESLITAFSQPFPVFFNDVSYAKDKATYFDQICRMDFEFNNNIFFRG